MGRRNTLTEFFPAEPNRGNEQVHPMIIAKTHKRKLTLQVQPPVSLYCPSMQQVATSMRRTQISMKGAKNRSIGLLGRDDHQVLRKARKQLLPVAMAADKRLHFREDIRRALLRHTSFNGEVEGRQYQRPIIEQRRESAHWQSMDLEGGAKKMMLTQSRMKRPEEGGTFQSDEFSEVALANRYETGGAVH